MLHDHDCDLEDKGGLNSSTEEHVFRAIDCLGHVSRTERGAPQHITISGGGEIVNAFATTRAAEIVRMLSERANHSRTVFQNSMARELSWDARVGLRHHGRRKIQSPTRPVLI